MDRSLSWPCLIKFVLLDNKPPSKNCKGFETEGLPEMVSRTRGRLVSPVAGRRIFLDASQPSKIDWLEHIFNLKPSAWEGQNNTK